MVLNQELGSIFQQIWNEYMEFLPSRQKILDESPTELFLLGNQIKFLQMDLRIHECNTELDMAGLTKLELGNRLKETLIQKLLFVRELIDGFQNTTTK